MPFSLSVGVNVVEKDFTTVVPAVSSSVGAFAGAFAWGPVLEPTIISGENDLVKLFGKPNSKNYTSFWSAANFLSYTNSLILTRVDSNATNACSEPSGSVTTVSFPTGTQDPVYNTGFTFTFDTSTEGTTATASYTLVGTTIASAAVTAGGTGYDGVPTVTVVRGVGDTTGTGATVTATIAGGLVNSLTVTNAGTGYTAIPTLVFSTTQVGTGATAHVTALTGNGITTGNLVIDSGGASYSASPAPTVTFTGGGGTGATGTAVLTGGAISSITINNAGSGYTSQPVVNISGQGSGATVAPAVLNPTKVASIQVVLPGDGYRTTPALTIRNAGGSVITPTVAPVVTVAYSGVVDLNNANAYHNSFSHGLRVYGEFCAKYPGSLGNAIKISVADAYNYNSLVTPWEFKNEFDGAPGTSQFVSDRSGSNDEIHIVVIDTTGAISGVRNTILEKFAYLSKASDGKLADGSNNYYKDVINQRSKYVWWLDTPATTSLRVSAGNASSPSTVNWGTAALGTNFALLNAAYNYQFSLGTDGALGYEYLLNDSNQQAAYSLYQNADLYDISLVVCGKMSSTTASYVINNIAETRKDCIVFCSPQHTAANLGGPIIGDDSAEINALIAYRTGYNGANATAEGPLPSSSYGVCDSGYKYQYDRYNDKYWWVPLNADVAGLCARTDNTNDPWWSPGGFNRGQIKNAVKLAHNPNQTARDNLYKNSINPVVSFRGQGVVLYGDKTLLTKPSAFDRINVRRLFIVLEKSIAIAAKYSLFELNDAFTRAQFTAMVEPFLRDVQGRRGIIDFRVKCDESNNTGEVIDRNEFAGDIYIKPARSINFINLSFVAVRSAVSFDEIGA